MPRAGRAVPVFEIWRSDRGVYSIDNPVRLAILHRLERSSATLGDIVATTKKAKSTLSALHMPGLLDARLVVETPHPQDGRIKVYQLTGQRLGRSDVDATSLREAVLGFVRARGMVPLRPVLEILDPAALMRQDPAYVTAVADRLGHVIARALSETGAKERFRELAGILEAEGITTLAGTPDAWTAKATRPWNEAVVRRIVQAALGPTS